MSSTKAIFARISALQSGTLTSIPPTFLVKNIKKSTMTVEKSICVFCGSAKGKDPIYAELADQLGKALVEKNWGLVYGGGTTG